MTEHCDLLGAHGQHPVEVLAHLLEPRARACIEGLMLRQPLLTLLAQRAAERAQLGSHTTDRRIEPPLRLGASELQSQRLRGAHR